MLLTRYVAMWPAASSCVPATADRATMRAKRAAVLPRTRPGRKVKQKCDQNLHSCHTFTDSMGAGSKEMVNEVVCKEGFKLVPAQQPSRNLMCRMWLKS